jgi:hypothetical protein
LEEALTLYRARGDEVFAARVVQHLGYVALLRHELAEARGLFTESLRALFTLDEKPGVADGLEAAAAVAAITGNNRQAGQLVEAAAVLREEIGVASLPALRALWHPLVERAEQGAAEAVWAAARKQGRSMSLQEAVAIAVGEGS